MNVDSELYSLISARSAELIGTEGHVSHEILMMRLLCKALEESAIVGRKTIASSLRRPQQPRCALGCDPSICPGPASGHHPPSIPYSLRVQTEALNQRDEAYRQLGVLKDEILSLRKNERLLESNLGKAFARIDELTARAEKAEADCMVHKAGSYQSKPF